VAPVGLVTGASRGLGLALARALVDDGWRLVIDARDPARLEVAAEELSARAGPAGGEVLALPGDVADPGHRADLAVAVQAWGRLDLLAANASTLGPTPLRAVPALSPDDWRHILEVNLVAPADLVRLTWSLLTRTGGRLVTVSSDAAVEAYPTWGGYGAAKAALDHLTAVLGAESPEVRVYAVDPGDMATELHRAAVPDADLTSLPDPASVVPALLRLVHGDLPSGRYRAADLLAAGADVGAGVAP
jgi:NAD(P)-dependent dehydrogenase (short-subunit alcohol dehydrogenase family)